MTTVPPIDKAAFDQAFYGMPMSERLHAENIVRSYLGCCQHPTPDTSLADWAAKQIAIHQGILDSHSVCPRQFHQGAIHKLEKMLEYVHAHPTPECLHAKLDGGKCVQCGEFLPRFASDIPLINRVAFAIDAAISNGKGPYDTAQAAIDAMGDASTRKDEGSAGTPALKADPASRITNSLATPSEITDNSLTALEALTYLVSLKAHKDQFGKTTYYQQAQPRAWERAIKALGNESTRSPEPVSIDLQKCANAAHDALHGCKAPGVPASVSYHALAKAVLEAAGVKYVP